ncbi:MAG: class I SAM-dependent methyltransferase [Campylobacteraceae bacterium]
MLLALKNIHISNYFKQFIVAPRATGSILPSSKTLCLAMLDNVEWQTHKHFLELGAGNGVLTKEILSRMRSDATLVVYEIREEFVKELKAIDDPRLIVKNYSAEYLDGNYDIVFSSLPLVSLPTKVSLRILKRCLDSLSGRQSTFVQFHYSPFAEKLLSRYFLWTKKLVVKNVPPAFVYHCRPNYLS